MFDVELLFFPVMLYKKTIFVYPFARICQNRMVRSVKATSGDDHAT